MPRESGDKRGSVDRLEFHEDEPDELYRHTHPLADAHSGWITIRPVVSEAEPGPAPSGVFASWLSLDRHDVALCSWVAGRTTRRGARPDSIGVQHNTGTRAAERLAARAVAVPAGWRRVQDHPRRGLVVQPPLGCPVEEMLSWLLRAGRALSSGSLTGRWQAEVHPPASHMQDPEDGDRDIPQ